MERGGAARLLRGVSTNSNVLHGSGVGMGVVIAPAIVLPPPPVVPADEVSLGVETDVGRVHGAFKRVARSLRDHLDVLEGDLQELVEVAALLAEDQSFIDQTIAEIRDAAPAATAVDLVSNRFVESFEQAGGLLAERVSDVRSVRDRVVAQLLDVPYGSAWDVNSAGVVVAADLSPADASLLPADKVLGIVTRDSGPTSHVAVLSRQWGVPAVVGVSDVGLGDTNGGAGRPDPSSTIRSGDELGLNALTGAVVLRPSVPQRGALRKASQLLSQTLSQMSNRQGLVPVRANVSKISELDRVLEHRAAGIGLFRSESMFLNRRQKPSVAEQEAIYDQLYARVIGHKIIIRTLDAGADKPLAFICRKQEHNPALGVRGIRTARANPDVLNEQLLAIANASARAGRESWVMAPMVATREEAQGFADVARSFGIDRVGVMIEVPSAAVMAEDLADVVDFMSIGTNDLTQYVMASDREDSELSDLNTAWQPAVLRLISHVADVGTRKGVTVSVCGEAAADPLFAAFLIGVGVAEISIAPAATPLTQLGLTQVTRAECHRMAQEVLKAATVEDTHSAAMSVLSNELRLLLDFRFPG